MFPTPSLVPGSGASGNDNSSSARSAIFQQLRPICTGLMQIRSQPDQLRQSLDQLTSVLQGANADGLQACFDYVSFPLLLMLDSVAAVRLPAAASADDGSAEPAPGGAAAQQIAIPAASSDRVAEALVQCLQALLQRCRCADPDQLVTVLHKLVPLLQLDRSRASEELRTAAAQSLLMALRGSCGRPERGDLSKVSVGLRNSKLLQLHCS